MLYRYIKSAQLNGSDITKDLREVLNGDSEMGRQKFTTQIEAFTDEFNQRVYHPILNRDVGQPKLNEQLLYFLLLPKLNGEAWTPQMQQAAIAVGAVYAAFDAHDGIPLDDVTTEEEQLRVLAGDYLSGIYYSLLAAVPDFTFIHTLATAIGKINELKVEHYTDLAHHLSANFEAVQQIQSACVIGFLHTYGFEKYVPLVETGMSLLAIGHNEQPADLMTNQWTYEHESKQAVLKEQRLEMETQLQEATFLGLELEQSIKEMTLPLLGETI